MVYKSYSWQNGNDAVDSFVHAFENGTDPELHIARKYVAFAIGHSIHSTHHLKDQVLKFHDENVRETQADFDYRHFKIINNGARLT